ncbi:hypothetical protein LPJ59_001192 [Coemansia sp. RSA 2399]|nr:hypothetical protein LPJ59_001192 [Coemansia sp. RSA 2399]
MEVGDKDTCSLWIGLPFVVWRRIAFHYHNQHAPEPSESEARRFDQLLAQTRQMLHVASINRTSRTAFVDYIYRDAAVLVDECGTPSHRFIRNTRMLTRARSLYIKVESQIDRVWSRDVVCGIRRLLPDHMPHLVNIVVESTKLEGPLTLCGPVFREGPKKLSAPRLGVVHVIDLTMDRDEVNRHEYSLALRVAGYVAEFALAGLKQVEAIEDTRRPAQYPLAYPIYTSGDLGLEDETFTSSLEFSDMGLVPQAIRLVVACRARLVSLKFLCCELHHFIGLFRAPDGSNQRYPYLEEMRGALSNNTSSRDNIGRPVFPPDVLPRLLHLHEITTYAWQHQRGVISHLLVDTLTTSVLPRLRSIRTRASQTMTFASESVPRLEYASYYSQSEFPEYMSARVVLDQFRRLLTHRGIRYIRYYDQVPPLQLTSAHLEIKCTALQSLDMGIIIVSFDAIVELLRKLKQVHTLYCTINNGEVVPQERVTELGDRPVSESVSILGMCIADNRPLRLARVAAREPSDEILCRLPNLRQLQIQGDVDRICELFNRQKDEDRFEWSAKVAEQVEILAVDLFARTKQ